MSTSNEELRIETTPKRAELSIRGLITLEADIGSDDTAAVMKVLGKYIFGSADDGAEIKLGAGLREHEADGRSELVMGDYAAIEDHQGTFLTLHSEPPAEYGWCDFKVVIGQERLANMWSQAKGEFLRHEQSLNSKLLCGEPEGDEMRQAVQTLRMVKAILQYVSDEEPSRPLVEVFQDWLGASGRRGTVHLRPSLPLAA